jgi:hypothetical protein
MTDDEREAQKWVGDEAAIRKKHGDDRCLDAASESGRIGSSGLVNPYYYSAVEILLLRLNEARDEIADKQRTFDLLWAAQMRAIERWQAAHPGNEMVWPDHAMLVEWLLEEIARLTAASA